MQKEISDFFEKQSTKAKTKIRAMAAKKSFQNMPANYKDILNVEKHPKLK